VAIQKTNCPKCNVPFTSKAGFAVGEVIRCPKCGTNFAIQQPAPQKPKPAPPKPPATKLSAKKVAKVAAPEPEIEDEPTPRKSSVVGYLVVGLLGIVVGIGGYMLYEKQQRDRQQTAETGTNTSVRPTQPSEEPPPQPKIDAPGTGGTPKGETPKAETPKGETPKKEPPKGETPKTETPKGETGGKDPTGKLPKVGGDTVPPKPAAEPFPRRLLFINISKYFNLNPLNSSPVVAADRTKAISQALATQWKIPADKDNSQVFLLSDTAPAPDGRVPTKDVVRGTYEKFFETSRGQDRIVVYFGGHAVEVDGKVYLAPTEGDLDDVSSLIPLDEFYAKLGACKATQKIVIWDVCRFNPQRIRLRPGSEPMSPGLAKAFANAPSDVEVITACQAGENALEFASLPSEKTGTPPHSGSVFLEALQSYLEKHPPAKAPSPSDPIRIADLAPALTTRAAEVVRLALGSGSGTPPTQTVKATGKMRNMLVAPDPNEPFAKRFDIPSPTRVAPVADVSALLKEFAVPPIKPDASEVDIASFPFRDDALKDYKADVSLDEILKNKEKYKFRATVADAVSEVRNVWKPGGGGLKLRETFSAPVTNGLKGAVKTEQGTLAVGIAKLELLNQRLDALVKDREAQPPRWQANYDYARAVVKARLAYMNEYDLMLGNVQTETLPERDAKQDSYRLVSTETAKMKSKKDVKQLATDAGEIFDKLIADRKGTPWALQAKRDKAVALGLAWQPASK
jgi:hypothetical protein